jgi:hypothetical protein
MLAMARVDAVKCLAVGVLACCAAAPSSAAECHGVMFPDHTVVNGTPLTLNGLGLRKATFLKVNVYVAALYLAHPTHDPKAIVNSTEPQQLILQFVRDVESADLTKAWGEGFARNSPDRLPALQSRIARLDAWMANIKSGQRLTFVRSPAGIQVEVNGAVKGTLAGDDFARAFFSIWFGVPPNRELQSGLLGGRCE